MNTPFARAIGIGLGSIAYDLMVNPGFKSIDYKKAIFMFGFCWLVLGLASKRAQSQTGQEPSA